MPTDSDWFPSKEPEQVIKVTNIRNKIEGYKSPLEMDDEDVTEVLTLCNAFLEAVMKNEEIQATAQTMTTWKNTIKYGSEEKLVGSSAPAAPAFSSVSMPAGATCGIVPQLRAWRSRWLQAKDYTETIGEDLMILRPEVSAPALDLLLAAMKLSMIGGYTTQFVFSLQEMDAMDVEWRYAGTEMWNFARTFTASPATHTVAATTPNQPVAVEYRGRLVKKNQQVGQWSPIYTSNAAP